MWACFNKAKSSFVAFVENDGDDEDDNHIFSGSKLSVTLSESTRCHGLTIFENEGVIKFSPLAFYSKISFFEFFIRMVIIESGAVIKQDTVDKR